MKTFKSIFLFAATILLAFTCVSCGYENKPEESSEASHIETPESTWVFGEAAASATAVSDGNFIKAAEVDKTYVSGTENGFVMISATADVFEIGGIEHPNENGNEYFRLDASNKTAYTSNNTWLAGSTAGACVRFRTNASSIIIKATMRNVNTGMNHFANRGAYGFDLYTGTGTDRTYLGAQMQMFTNATSFTETVTLPGGYQEVQLNLPLYGGVSSIYIGIPSDSEVALPTARDYAPIAFYGSSITQGGCVSRPGNMYSNIICRALNADNMNLGFSGSALGEQSIAEYIASREISAFVMDYDYNSPTVQSLKDTHYDFYKTVRDGHPDIPIILVTHPYYAAATSDDDARKNVIKETFLKALADGDTNIYYVDSESFFPEQMRDLYAVDNLHPNDLGNFKMAEAIFPVLSEALKTK